MVKAFQKDDVLLENIRRAPSEAESFTFWWLGQSGFLIKWNGRYLLFDPYLSDSLTKKYANTDKPHVRMSERAIEPHRLDFVDLVTSSHNHTDHLDAETLLPMMQANPDMKILVATANRAFAADRLNFDPDSLVALDAGQSAAVQGFQLTAVPAAHEALERDDEGHCRYLGFVAAFGGFAVYHSGDTVLYEGMADVLRPFCVDVAFLPINGSDPVRRVAGNLNAAEAAQLGMDIRARLVVPCHYDMFAFNTADPAGFVAAANTLGQAHRVLRTGEGFTMKKA